MKAKACILILLFAATISLYGCSNHKSTEKEIENFYQVIDDIDSNFVYEGFEEIMNRQSHVLALPLEYAAIDDAEKILGAQKLFVYKSREQGVIIMLQVTFSRSLGNEWNSSVDYSSKAFNSINSSYGDFYNESIPDVEVASNSFTFKGCTYSTLSISGKSSSSFAATELTNFSNKLIQYLT